MSNRINGVVAVTEMGEGWEKRKFSCGGGVVRERIAGGNQVFCFEYVKFQMLTRHLVTCAVFLKYRFSDPLISLRNISGFR